MIRNRPPEHLAQLLGDLTIEDQVVVFRLVAAQRTRPRRSSIMSLEQQETLLKAMAQEDVAALLNEMAPDDRTMFLEELPAAATRQLLALADTRRACGRQHAARLPGRARSAG